MKKILFILLTLCFSCSQYVEQPITGSHEFNGIYENDNLNRIAFPMGGIGSGMVCLEGTGALSHVSLRHQPNLFNEPLVFAALSLKNENGNIARIVEGPVPKWKIFGKVGSGNGLGGTSYGLPRFSKARFSSRFPFSNIELEDKNIPVKVNITGWSPFIPTDDDNSSLPVAALEYTLINNSGQIQEGVFSFNSENFMKVDIPRAGGGTYQDFNSIMPYPNGFLLWQEGKADSRHEGAFGISIPDEKVIVDHCWFRGGWFDPISMIWKRIETQDLSPVEPVKSKAPGASIFVPFIMEPGTSKTIKVLMSWHVPFSNVRTGSEPDEYKDEEAICCTPETHKPWYTSEFRTAREVGDYWNNNYDELRDNSKLFSDAFFSSTLPPEVLEAISANLSILKSPTVMRQFNGKLWCYEGCGGTWGCCAGSCTHVWNYAQAIPHLFPNLERSLRHTEFNESQSGEGHQTFRSLIPVRTIQNHSFHAASDGQLGGIMKVYRDWRISGDNAWLEEILPKVKTSLDYCISAWDPKHKGVLEEPHHNTYDIEFWGPDGMCTSFYLGALTAYVEMGSYLEMDVRFYDDLLKKGKKYFTESLYNGEYFIQEVVWEGLEADDPVEAASGQWNVNYSEEALKLLQEEGPKYQYGNGCISDGVLGLWMAKVCGLDEDIIDPKMVDNHISAVYKYNLKHDLSSHVNPQRPSFAMGDDGGLLLCTWPHNDAPSLPFVYSNEVWTGIEYQVAAHLMLSGMAEEGLDIVRTARKRYDGTIRNPFDEYECGHWYARALASYAMIQALSGARYDAVDKSLYLDSRLGHNYKIFLSTQTGWGMAGLKNGKPYVDAIYGSINVEKYIIDGKTL